MHLTYWFSNAGVLDRRMEGICGVLYMPQSLTGDRRTWCFMMAGN